MDTLFLLMLGLVAILAIIAAGGYFVAQEFAYMAVDRARLAAEAAKGDKAAQRALAVTRRTSFMLSGAQLGITVTGLLVGYVAEPMVGRSLGMLLGGVGIPTEVGIAIGTTGVLVGAALIQMIFGELYPKNLAIAHSGPLARALASSTLIYLAAFGWLIAFFDKAANLFLRLLRIEPVHDLDVSASADDLRHIIADSRETGDLPVELSLMMDRMLDFPQRTVEHAMIPRPKADWVRTDVPLEDMRALMAREHTRYPVLGENDQPAGVIELADVLRHLDRGKAEGTVNAAMRRARVVPEFMPLPAALSMMQDEGLRMVCVVDEYGSFAGILTLEDIAMEIVGEITDEHDPGGPEAIVAQGENLWIMAGDAPLDEVERAIGHKLPEGQSETIAGLAIAVHGLLPEEGTQVEAALPLDPGDLASGEVVRRKLIIDILKVERHIPAQVLVRMVETTDSGGSQ